MRKGFLFVVVAVLLSCSGNRKQGNAGKENAILYAKEMVFAKMDGVKTAEVTATDSVLTHDMLDESSFNSIADGVAYEGKSDSELRAAVDSLGNVQRDIYFTWNDQGRKDAVRGKYAGHWRLLYTVTATLESGAQKEVRVLMMPDGLTPSMTEDEYKDQRKKSTRLVDVMTGTLNWNY